MLELIRSYAAQPVHVLTFLSLPGRSLLLYPSADVVLIVHARSLILARALAFSDIHPATRHLNASITSLAVDSAMKLIVASLGSRIAAWSLSGVQHDTWRIHSSLTLPESQTITALDCRSGLLAVATSSSLSVYTLILENDLPTWTIKWSSKSSSSPTRVRFSPSLMHIVTTSRQDNTVRVYLTTSGRQTQGIPHLRPVTNIAWRHTQASSRDDLILYTITADSTLRIFLPVLDAPQHLQLHASLDLFSSVHPSLLSPSPSSSPSTSHGSSVFWLDREIMGDALDRILKQHSESQSEDENEDEEAKLRIRKLREIQEEGWDLFLRVLPDGAVVVTAVANIDRRPPTLLRHFTLLQTAPAFLSPSPSSTPSHLHILPHPNLGQAKNTTQLTLTLITYPHLTSFELEPKEFFGGSGGLRVIARGGEKSAAEHNEGRDEGEKSKGERRGRSEKGDERGQESRILRFVRTPDGRAVGVVREKGGEVWTLEQDNEQDQDRGTRLGRRGRWESADRVVVLDGGRTFATYSNTSNLLTLHLPTSPAPLTLRIPRVSSLFSLPPVSGRHECIFGITEVGGEGGGGVPSILHVHATMGSADGVPGQESTSEHEEPRLWMHSETTLGGEIGDGDAMAFILPVDPMAWSGGGAGGGGSGGGRTQTNVAHDVLLGVAQDGDLTFWVPEEGAGSGGGVGGGGGWRRTGRVRTGRRGIRMARCSSAKKTVLVVPSERGEELTIWDSKESEFASGLEYSNIVPYDSPGQSSANTTTINDLDWSSTPDGQSILAVGFAHHVDILCQQRMTYFEEGESAAAGWGVVRRIDVREMLPHPISDSIWLAHGALLVGSDRQMCLYGEKGRSVSSDFGEKPVDEADEPESLFEHVARLNGPLEEYHPQMLLQCLLWEKMELVKEIIVNLAKNVQRAREAGGRFVWTEVPVDHFLRKEQMHTAVNGRHRKQYISLFDIPEQNDENEDEGFSRDLVEKLLTQLEEHPLPHLTPNEHAHLLVLIQATLEVDESRRALDANGLRYLISMRSFYILNHRASAPNSPSPHAEPGAARRAAGWRARLRYRDMIWAFHSESQGLLLTTSVAACEGGKMTWSEARALGVFLWLNGLDAMKSHMEVIARNEYMANDARDPVACSLFYFALGKSKLVHGLWRQAAWHKEQQVMLKFLNNDFRQARWRTAAMKNAFALLSKRRFEYAAAFFILGGSLKDAVNVCIKQLNDFQLAVALCRIVEQSDEGPILQGVLNGTVIPLAFKSGNRWLASWAFWLLRRRDLAVRILVMPLQDIATSFFGPAIMEIGSPHYDDPSLALLFSQLKAKTLQTAKGTSEISGRLEFNFILQIARVFTKMGCHVLALDLVRSWSFDRPSTVSHDPPTSHAHEAPPSPTSARRLFALGPAMRRRSSILIDMDVSTQPPTRRPSPEPVEQNANAALTPTTNLNGDGAQSRTSLSLSIDGEGGLPVREGEEKMKEDEGDLVARKAGMGSLMKSAKHDVQVPEFDMNAFF